MDVGRLHKALRHGQWCGKQALNTAGEKKETLLRSGKTKLQALSGKVRDLHGGRREAGARGGEQDPKEDRQQRRGTQGEAPRGGGGQAQHQPEASTGQDHDTQTATRRTRRAGGGRAGERARGRAGGRRGGPAAAGGGEDGRTGRPASKRTDGGPDGRAGGRGGRRRPVPPGAAAKGGGHDLTHGREPNQPRGVRATALPLPSHVGRRRLPHGNGQGAQAKATTKAAAHKTPLWTPIDLQG